MDRAVADFLELRIRVRRNPEARALGDRCLSLISQAREADADSLVALDRQVEALRAKPERRLGPPEALVRH